MKKIFLLLTIVSLIACGKKNYQQTTIQNNLFINANKDTILIGKAKPKILLEQPWFKWYDTMYNNYKVDTARALMASSSLKNKKCDIFLGTWCGDTRREVPRMLKIFKTAGFDESNVNLIFVDNADNAYKRSNNGEEVGKNIHHVPTFIFYENDKEVGRIVETPLESFEKDLSTIFSGLPYTPKYKAIEIWEQRINNKDKILDTNQIKNIAKQLAPICRHSGELNTYGYMLMSQKKFNQAINIFKINVEIYYWVANCYDSLGEAFYKLGNKEEAIKNYKKVLELDPENKSAKKMLEKLVQ